MFAGPNVASIEYKGVWYTLFPERVNYTEAAAACKQLPNGRLAQLEGQAALTAVGNALLPTLPMQVRHLPFVGWGCQQAGPAQQAECYLFREGHLF